MTLMKSKTTRRSHPMIRSRLRSPTSKSMTTVRWPRRASPAAKAAELVVLPTPPLPDVITTTFAKAPSPAQALVRRAADAGSVFSGASRAVRNPNYAGVSNSDGLIPGNRQLIVEQRDLRRAALVFRGQLLADQIAPGDADQLGFEPRTEDPRAGVARDAGQRPAAQRAV